MELVVVIGMLSIVGYFTLPHVPALSGVFDRSNARAFLMHDIKRAQAQAITQGCRGIIEIATNGKSYRYGCDFLSYDTSINPAPDVTSFMRNLPNNIVMTASSPLIFNSRGQAVDRDFIINSVTIELVDASLGEGVPFAQGLLTGTGVFNYQ